ncbi:unnamed protein product, partial [Vitis vinifera]|uniref:Uncharacterized protein n=1 Tax=Vitis vinifera TaxID=29760 RepID=E0CU68_VITVI
MVKDHFFAIKKFTVKNKNSLNTKMGHLRKWILHGVRKLTVQGSNRAKLSISCRSISSSSIYRMYQGIKLLSW